MFNQLEKLISFCNDHEEFDYLVNDIMEEDFVEEWLECRATSWKGVYRALCNIDYVNAPYFIVDGYGHLRDVTPDDIRWIVYELTKEIEYLDDEDYKCDLYDELTALLGEEELDRLLDSI